MENFYSRLCKILVLLSFQCHSKFSVAQCSDWAASARIITGSTCAANGSFEVTLSGPDLANLSNIQYAVPATGQYTVPLNSSPIFNSVPGGTWPVNVVALCGGNFVGKNTAITMPGDYLPPSMNLVVARNSLNCAATGRITARIAQGRAPYNILLVSRPPGYTGPTSFTSSQTNYTIDNLPVGVYTVQVTDDCNSGTNFQTITVNGLNPINLPLQFDREVSASNCNQILVPKPYVNYGSGAWTGYPDNLFQIAATIDGGVAPATVFESWTNDFSIALNPGFSIKDLYGKYVNYTIRPICGSDFTTRNRIPFPEVSTQINQNCNIDFKAILGFKGLICFPVSYTITGNGNTYGPFTTNQRFDTTVSLPIGNYTVQFTTADGYTASKTIGVSPITGTPYSVSLYFNSAGLHNYFDGFLFTTSLNSASPRTIELFSGPAGYNYFNQLNWFGTQFRIDQNQVSTPSTIKFPPGNYVWKITDDCGSYFLPITVTTDDLYQYTIGIDSTSETCKGLYIRPAGTITHKSQSVKTNYLLLKEDTAAWLGIPKLIGVSDTSFLLTDPGTYFIIPYAFNWSGLVRGDPPLSVPLGFPNIYTKSVIVTYKRDPLMVDMDRSQGFICSGIPGQGEIHVQGKGGIQFSGSNYKYYLANVGNGLSGPYIANNTTGVFTNFGANSGDIYEVKVEDSCGAFVVQKFEILDLRSARLIASSTYVACDSARVQLIALYLPGATYSWTGPNGFTSSQRNPVIESISPTHIGVYRVSITIPQCSYPITDTTIITSNFKPIPPELSLKCLPLSTLMQVVNPQPGYDYKWEHSLNLGGGWTNTDILDSDTNFTMEATVGNYRAIAIDTSTKCRSYSDSLHFPFSHFDSFKVWIYTPHTDICPGDTTTLVVQNNGLVIQPNYVKYQWFFDGVPIPGANDPTYAASLPGEYRVSFKTDTCNIDTSAAVVVRLISLPLASLKVSDSLLCKGDTAILEADAGLNYSYTWNFNGTTIPGVNAPTLRVTEAGDYFVTIANAGCARVSDTVQIRVFDPPIVQLNPNIDQKFCDGDSVVLNTINDSRYGYRWMQDGSQILGADSSFIKVFAPGRYSVSVSSEQCPEVHSDTILVEVIPFPSTGLKVSDSLLCKGDTAILEADASQHYNYTWYHNGNVIPGANASTIRVTQGGDYFVSIANDICVSVSDTKRIQTFDPPVVQLNPNTDQKICEGDTLLLQTIRDIRYAYQWKKSGSQITGADSSSLKVFAPGRYSVSVSSEHCPEVHSDTILVDVVIPPTASIIATDTIICEGDSAIIHAAKGPDYLYSWYRNGQVVAAGNDPTLYAILPGNYHVVVDNGGCERVSNLITITVHTRPVANLIPSGRQVLCVGDSLLLETGSGIGYRYNWYRNGQLMMGSNERIWVREAGKYQVHISSEYCPESWSDTVEVVALPKELNLGSDTLICESGPWSIPLSAPEGFDNYLWSNGSQSRSIAATYSGKWWLQAVNQCGIFSDTILITTADDYQAAFPRDTIVCNPSGSLVLHASPLVQSVIWSTGATSRQIMVNEPGIYWVVGEGSCGTVRDTIRVRFCEPKILGLSQSSLEICAGECIELSAVTGNYPLNIRWQLPGGKPEEFQGERPGKICYSVPGVYPIILSLTNSGGTVTRESSIMVLPQPNLRFTDTMLTVAYKSAIQLNACAEAKKADWYIGDSLICASCPTLHIEPRMWKQEYRCIVSNGNCIDSCVYIVQTRDIPSDLVVPSAFSPNSDGKNDVFRVVTSNPNIVVEELIIYNRWGNQVYKGHGNAGWDGNYKGQPAPNGTYFWHLKYSLLNSDEIWISKGDLTLVR